MRVHKARNIFFFKFQRNKYRRRRLYFIGLQISNKKQWKFEAVTNIAIVSPVFCGVQSWSLLEVYSCVVVICCWAEDVGIFFKSVGKCLKISTTPNTLLYFKTAISNRLRASNKIMYLVDTCLWWPELTDLEININCMGVISYLLILRKHFLFLVQWNTIHTKR